MRRLSLLLLVVILAAFTALIVAQEHSTEGIHWSYEGEGSPEHWGDLEAEYELCKTGKTQSPIDVESVVSVDIGDITFNYTSSALNILNNGHTVQVNYDSGSTIEFNGVTYDLKQFHFHTPSEHSIDGEFAPMEVHFVHADANGNLAVVGVMLMAGESDNAAYSAVFENLPPEEAEVTTLDFTVSAADMLPAEKTFFTYTGSLTTPPCSEGVRWLLLDTPVSLSVEQIEAFEGIFELNARPVQPVNARDVLNDTATGS